MELSVKNPQVEKIEAEQLKQLEVIRAMTLQGRSDKEIGAAIGRNANAIQLIRSFLGLAKAGRGGGLYAICRNLTKEQDNTISIGRINLNRLQKEFDCDKMPGLDSTNMHKYGWRIVSVDGTKITVEVIKK